MLKVALTHDVDRTKKSYQYFTGVLKSLKKGRFSDALYHMKKPAEEPYWNFYKIAELEDSYKTRSTFFMLDESIRFKITQPKTFALAMGRYNLFEPKIQEAVRYLDANGWEIGLHGSYNSYKDKELLGREKKRLESIIGHPVIGTRQHYLNLDQNTWKIQEELGFKYDSTWGYNDGIGFKEGRRKAFFPNNSKFVVYPMPIMDICFMKTSNRWERYKEILDEAEENDAIVVVNFHHRVYNEKEYPGFRSAYCRIIETALERKGEVSSLGHFFNQLHKY